MTPLSDEERNRIRLEEEYRQEVRLQLTDHLSAGGGFWKALNSNFGLWLLSALFISGLGTLYTNCQATRERETTKAREIERLDLEISYRFSGILGRLSALRDRARSDSVWRARAKEDITEVLTLLKEPTVVGVRFLYPEYKDYSLPALLADLRRNLENTPGLDFYDDDDRGTVDSVLGTIVGFVPEEGADALERSQGAKDLGPPPTDPFEAAGRAVNELVRNRWRGKHFFYVGCPSDRPFC